jgi:hypothetical protein
VHAVAFQRLDDRTEAEVAFNASSHKKDIDPKRLRAIEH